MSSDSQQGGESTLWNLDENMFFQPTLAPNDIGLFKLLKDSAMMEEFLPRKDTESEGVSAEMVSSSPDELDLGYDTNSEVSSPMSAKSHWSDPATPSSGGSFQEDELELFPEFDEDTRNSLRSILDGDDSCSTWNLSDNTQNSNASSSEPSENLSDPSPRSPFVGQGSNIADGSVNFSTVLQLHNLLQSSEEGTKDAGIPTQTAKPVRKRAAASLSTCGLSPRKRPKKYPSLIQTLPEKQNGAELQILVQPEKHHRARYRTEGSRGSVKDDSGENYPKLKLTGVNQPVTLQVFVGIDQGKIRPHGYYQACKVTGRNTTPCEEKDVDGTTIIEVPWEPAEGNMELSVDCIGILKLRNADVEQRIGPLRSKRKSTCVRLVFRVLVPVADGSYIALQTASRSITCTQPLGQPEIVKKSLTKCSVAGGEELFIIGKNFTSKATTEVKLRQLDNDGKVAWEGDCEIDKALFQNNHIVCTIPPYPNQNVKTPVQVYLVVTGKPNHCSELEAHPIEYVPKPDAVEKNIPSACNHVQETVGATTTTSPVLPPTPTSPEPAAVANPLRQVTVLKVEPQTQVLQQQPSPPPEQGNGDAFALALQMLATTYVKNKDSYNSLLSQIQLQSQAQLSTGSLQVLEVLQNH